MTLIFSFEKSVNLLTEEENKKNDAKPLQLLKFSLSQLSSG